MITERMQQLAGVSEASLLAHSGLSWDVHKEIIYDGEKVAIIKQERKGRKYKYTVVVDKEFKKKSGVYGGEYSSDKKALDDIFKKIRNSEKWGKLSRLKNESINEALFRTNHKVLPADLEKLKKNYQAIGKDYMVGQDKDGDWWGYRKGQKEADWRWAEDSEWGFFRLHTDVDKSKLFRVIYKRAGWEDVFK